MKPDIIDFESIPGVQIAQLKAFGDDRGRFTEIFRKEWFPQRNWSNIQMNRSESIAGVLRGLHYHFKQVDYWFLMSGRIRVGLADLRRSSPTFRKTEFIDLDGQNNTTGIFIPVGVAHGFRTITDATLLYVVDNYYDGSDELGLAWNDPDVSVNWGGISMPVLSPRDANNPFFKDIEFSILPE